MEKAHVVKEVMTIVNHDANTIANDAITEKIKVSRISCVFIVRQFFCMPGIEKKECHFYEKINHLVFHFFVILFI
jgi:hypothetical protein